MAGRKRKKRSTKRAERRHVVHASLDNFRLAKAKSALTLQIYSGDDKVGELKVGRGSLYWAGARRQSEKRIPWDRFAEKMDELAYGKD